MITNDLNTEIWVISDTHLIADVLHDNGQAFSRMQKTSQGKDLYYQETVLKSFVKMANEKQPAAIVVTGDITFNGERTSAERFAQIFKGLTKTKLLVVPGNHDIFDGWAREFRGKKQFYAGQISPMFWKSIFDKSYRASEDEDSNSLAYSVQLNPNYLLVLADSNYYGKEETTTAPFTKGAINKDELKWLEKQFKKASQQHLRPILFMHHNLYAHNPVVNQNYVLDNATEVRRLCARYNVKLAFSGHIHAQNIKSTKVKNQSLTDIASGALILGSHYYGTLKINQSNGTATYRATPLNVSAYIKHHRGNKAMRAYQKYDHDVLYAAGYNAALSQLYEDRDETQLSSAKVNQLARGMAAANIALFRGTPVKNSAAIQAWQQMPHNTSLRGFVLATKKLHGNVTWSGSVQ